MKKIILFIVSLCFTFMTMAEIVTVEVLDPLPVCAPYTVDLKDPFITQGSTPGLTYTYWTDAEATVKLASPEVIYYPGTYTYYIKGTSTSGAYDIKPVNVVIFPPIYVDISSNGPICEGSTLNLTNFIYGGTSSYTWIGPNGFISHEANPSIEFVTGAATGIYSLYVEDLNGCQNSQMLDVTVFSKPNISVSSNGPICEGSTLNLTSNVFFGSVSTYSWTGPNGFTSHVANPSLGFVTSAANGLYELIVTSPDGCRDTATVFVDIYTKPKVDVFSNSPICEGETLNLDNVLISGNAITYSWTGPNGFSLYHPHPSIPLVSLNANGIYELIVTNLDGCLDTATVNVTVIPKPTLIISNPNPVVVPNKVDLTLGIVTTGSDAGLYYTYWLDALATTALPNANVISASGTYYIKGENANGCSDIKPVIVTINNGTGLSETTAAAINIYPNPVGDAFQITGIENKATIDISDINGKLQLTKEVVNNEPISVNDLTSGIYTVKITTAKLVVEKKIVKK